MSGVKALVLVAGVLILAFGLLFAGQGAGLILWPASSFMLKQSSWVLYGAIVALAGTGLIWWSRR
ncbi:hypothetical protein E2E30_03235 [Sphingomonas sp. AAP5]|uniref:hypothetical protein n=1 Tax=Sphingomonas sp. AAP5 TaxID=1523415 RepID=UPI001057390E|nr:hypothetical protein [Sphingomonas sp. AAP5]QBM74880.1 hypothetical protein E2E30_03235 [Sphingomonas sp. AAP5]